MKRIGRYEILRELGRGAMGVVFKARDPVIGRIVALKTITANVLEDSDLMDRFRREAKTAGALHHPNIVTVYEMSEVNGIPLIAMEYLEGDSLDTLISMDAKLSLAQKIGYIAQACRALNYAHQNRVIHRDIKPGNIVVTVNGVVKVVDFGIARLADTSKTQTGALLGTLSYMAPQQLMGRPADERSDIWSTGVVIYELLTYQRLFREENQAAVLFSILNNEPPPLSRRLPNCPPKLQALVQKALCKNDAERYRTMEDLLLDLEPLWASFQRELLDELLTESQRLCTSGKLLEARGVLRRTIQIDASNITAKALLEEVNARITKGEAAPGVRRHTDKAEKLIAQGSYVEARSELETALKIARFDRIARRLLEEIPGEDQNDSEEELSTASARAIREYAMQAVAGLQKTQVAVAPHSIAAPRDKGVGKRKESLNLSLEETQVSKTGRKLRWIYAALLAAVIILAGTAFRARKSEIASLTRSSASSAAPGPPITPQGPSLSLEDQQQHLIDLAHEAADTNDYPTAQARLKDAENLNGPLHSRIQDLQQRFGAEEHSGELQEIAHRESALWNQALAQITSNRLDDAEKSFQQVLALPEGGRRRADAERYLNRVIPDLRQEEQLWAEAQQLSQNKDQVHLRQLQDVLDKIVAKHGPHQQQADSWRKDVAGQLSPAVARKDPGPTAPVASDSDRAHFAQMEDQFRKASQQADSTALEQLRSLRTQFRAVQDGGGPLGANAANYSNNLIPAAMKQIEDRLASAQALAAADSQLNDAVAQFNQAVAAKDSGGLKSRVLPEFQQIAQAGGPRAAEASRYVSAVIPAALRDVNPWPTIGCPAAARGLEQDVKPGTLVACGLLDPPKLQWVQFSWPEFPSGARQAGVGKGTAMLSLTVDQQGMVIEARPRGASDSYGFTDSAAQAASQWKTTPPRVQGKPVRTQFSVDIPFNP